MGSYKRNLELYPNYNKIGYKRRIEITPNYNKIHYKIQLKLYGRCKSNDSKYKMRKISWSFKNKIFKINKKEGLKG